MYCPFFGAICLTSSIDTPITMPLSPVFVDYALELLAGVGRVEARRMFGGAGLFRDGVMFALLDDDVIYVRVDDALQADLQPQGSVP